MHPTSWEGREERPEEVLMAELKSAEQHLVAKGLENDARIIEATRGRWDGYIRRLHRLASESAAKGQSLKEVIGRDGDQFDSKGRNRVFLLAANISKGESSDGGFIYYPELGEITDKTQTREQYDGTVKLWVQKGQDWVHEFVNQFPSAEGETELYRSLGILSPEETVADLPAVLERTVAKIKNDKRGDLFQIVGGSGDESEMYMNLPTNVPGVFLEISKEGSTDDPVHPRRRSLMLKFATSFLEEELKTDM